MDPYHIAQERARLLAGVLNMAAASCFTATMVIPAVSASACYVPGAVSVTRIAVVACIGLFTAAALHSFAVRVLEAALEDHGR